MRAIFNTHAGAVLHGYLTQRAQTMSSLSADGLVSQRETDIHEGRRYEAILLLGAPNILKPKDT